jgi:hypothetical protein
VPGFPPHPGADNLIISGHYFIKAGELNVATGPTFQRIWAGAGILGIVATVFMGARIAPLLLVLVPIPFYMLSIAYGSVPIFLPTWWPYSYYNVRYGTQLLPAAAIFLALAAYFLAKWLASARGKAIVLGVAVLVAVSSYYTVWRATPVCFQEAQANSRRRVALETAIASVLRTLPTHSTILMYLGEHGGALQNAAIPLRRTINEGDHRTWKQPEDPEGLWERALADPTRYAGYAIAVGSDPVATAMEHQEADIIALIDVAGQPLAKVYRIDKH